jgi:hypothetical protein
MTATMGWIRAVMLEPHAFMMFLCFCFCVFDEWLGTMPPTEEVDLTMMVGLTMMVNHQAYVFVASVAKQVDHAVV